jgi:hypothetical protein
MVASTLRHKRYSAMLLFAFQEGKSNSSEQTCESRILVCMALSANEALIHFKKMGVELQGEYTTNNGITYGWSFLGIQELLCLDLIASNDSEVWYDIFRIENPESLVPKESELCAIKDND